MVLTKKGSNDKHSWFKSFNQRYIFDEAFFYDFSSRLSIFLLTKKPHPGKMAELRFYCYFLGMHRYGDKVQAFRYFCVWNHRLANKNLRKSKRSVKPYWIIFLAILDVDVSGPGVTPVWKRFFDIPAADFWSRPGVCKWSRSFDQKIIGFFIFDQIFFLGSRFLIFYLVYIFFTWSYHD